MDVMNVIIRSFFLFVGMILDVVIKYLFLRFIIMYFLFIFSCFNIDEFCLLFLVRCW